MDIDTRALLFIFLCIPVRLTLAYLPQVLPERLLIILGIVLFIMSMGTGFLALTNKRMHAGKGGNTWWSNFRILHSALLGASAVYLFRNDRFATLPLVIDVIVGIIVFFSIRLGSFNSN